MKMTNNTLEIFPESHLGPVTTLLISNYQVTDTICQSLSPPPLSVGLLFALYVSVCVCVCWWWWGGGGGKGERTA